MAFYGSGATGAAIFGSVYGYISARYVDLPPTIGKEAFKSKIALFLHFYAHHIASKVLNKLK